MIASLFDAKTIDSLVWPETEQAKRAKAFILPIMKEGSNFFVENVETTLYALLVDEIVLPITVNHKEYDNSYVASCYSSVPYLKEKLKRQFPKFHLLFTPLTFAMGAILKALRINKVVTVNNLLFSTNLSPPLSKEQVETITKLLVKHFPDHLLMFRSVHTLDKQRLFKALQSAQYRLVASRLIFSYDPEKKADISRSARRKIDKDYKMIAKKDYSLVDVTKLSEKEAPRVLELYSKVYHKKYSAFSPKFTTAFLKHAIDQKLLHLKLIKKKETIAGVVGYYTADGILTDPFFGYDTGIDQSEGVYRMVSSLPMFEAERLNIKAHMGSGGDRYKLWRGLSPNMEYIGLYDRHLPLYRRSMWLFSEKLMNLIVMPLVKKRILSAKQGKH